MIIENLKQLRNKIREAELDYNRVPGSVLLLAVSKTKPAKDIAEAYLAGQRHFGENYCQEALQKQRELGAFDIYWHFIGPIQSNKIKLLASNFAWIHSVDSLKAANKLNELRLETSPPLNICLQVIHFHCCVIDGVFSAEDETLRFDEAAITPEAIAQAQAKVRERVLRLFNLN